jgi:hypothetical protein
MELASGLRIHKKAVVNVQSQTGYHNMLAVEKHNDYVDYSQLLEEVSGIAVNIATNQLCWKVLSDYANFIKQETQNSA